MASSIGLKKSLYTSLKTGPNPLRRLLYLISSAIVKIVLHFHTFNHLSIESFFYSQI